MKLFFLGLGTGVLLIAALVVVAIFTLKQSQKNIADQFEPVQLPGVYPVLADSDYVFHLSPLNGNTPISLKEFKGKVIFLNLWENWCAPCTAEMPFIEKLYNATKMDGVEFIVLSTQDKEKTKNFVSKKGFHLPFYHLEDTLPKIFAGKGIPRTYIIAPDGKIMLQHTGAANWFDEKTITFIKELAKSSVQPLQ